MVPPPEYLSSDNRLINFISESLHRSFTKALHQGVTDKKCDNIAMQKSRIGSKEALLAPQTLKAKLRIDN